MSKLLYNIFLSLYLLAIRIVAPFNGKAKLWLNGRKNVFQQLGNWVGESDKIIWVHCSSLGEFEQGRPLIEKLKEEYPAYQILLTFFSPSGYEVRKNYEVDYVFYLPMDGKQNAKRWFDLVNPSLIFFVKYEYWYYYLKEAKMRNVPLLLVSGIFRKDQPFFKWYGGVYREMLSFFNLFLLQTEESAKLLRKLGYKENVVVTGDTRFDRVIEIAGNFTPIEPIEKFIGSADVVVAGSTWTEDDKELDHYANTNQNVKFIIAPHNINRERLNECLSLYKHSILLSQLKGNVNLESVNTLIIDNIGMLSRLYKYATVTYVGGAFGADGVHNVLEPAVFGKPVVVGPEYEKYIEAVQLVEAGGGISIGNALELEKTLDTLLLKGEYYEEACNASTEYVYKNSGATAKIMKLIYEKRLLTN
ncbi:MAG: Three-deoxy-D-manno-octulosonic-acid transferase protein [Segetibacter sp.]|nr:Three-deoxy-D-manno-octulosonic-acid transferase protein [Segetibacter sp.]